MTRRVGTALLAVAVLLAGAVPAQAKPRTRPPTAPTRIAPPPAWIETRAGDRWLGYGSYCWTDGGRPQVCMTLPPETNRDIPRIVVRRGETVRFHLGFYPTRVGVAVGTTILVLPNRPTVSWRVPARGGMLTLSARGRRDVSYHARLIVRA